MSHTTTPILGTLIVDLPCWPRFDNSLDAGDCLHGGHYADDVAANYMHLNNQK